MIIEGERMTNKFPNYSTLATNLTATQISLNWPTSPLGAPPKLRERQGSFRRFSNDERFRCCARRERCRSVMRRCVHPRSLELLKGLNLHRPLLTAGVTRRVARISLEGQRAWYNRSLDLPQPMRVQHRRPVQRRRPVRVASRQLVDPMIHCWPPPSCRETGRWPACSPLLSPAAARQ